MMAVCVAFIINYACYFSEIYRGGIQGVPKGQQEAGQVLGMTKAQIFRHITLLQMIKRIVPPMSNEIITLVKDTSLARVIALQEVIWMGESFMKGNSGIAGLTWPLFFTAVYYLVFSGIVTVLLGKLEKKLASFSKEGDAIWQFWKYSTSKSTSAPPGCWRTSALTWSRARPWPSSAPPAPARPRCCGA